MNEAQFVERREADWKALVFLCDRADASPTFLESIDFHKLIKVYRRVSGDLAYARTKTTNQPLVDFLNDIVGRAYAILYRSPRIPLGKAIGSAIALVAQTVRRRRNFVFASIAILFVSCIFTDFLIRAVPATHDIFIPPSDANMRAWKNGLPGNRTVDESGTMAGFYAFNNPRVAVTASGVAAATFGVGTAYILWMNGVEMGALGHEMASVHKLPLLIGFILPHGVTELSGMILSASAGFVLGWALINPGRRKRGEALAEAGRDAIVMISASAIMMFMAAPIEGFFSFNTKVLLPVKYVVGILEIAAWAAFWVGYGRTHATPLSGAT